MAMLFLVLSGGVVTLLLRTDPPTVFATLGELYSATAHDVTFGRDSIRQPGVSLGIVVVVSSLAAQVPLQGSNVPERPS
jgi:hypothetical protein